MCRIRERVGSTTNLDVVITKIPATSGNMVKQHVYSRVMDVLLVLVTGRCCCN